MPQRKPSALSRSYAWFSAVAAEDTPLLDDLLAHGVPIDTVHPLRHSTALMEATRRGRAELVQWLIEHGAAPAFLCGLPLGTALHCALHRQHWGIANFLANAMESCAIMDVYGATPLHVLGAEAGGCHAAPGVLALASKLIAKSCPLDALDHEGTTALHHCVLNDAQELVAMLLRHGANPNALIPDSKVSPLTIAALEKNMPMAKLLLEFGGDPHAKTRDGATALSLFPAIAPLVNAKHMLGTDSHRADAMVH